MSGLISIDLGDFLHETGPLVRVPYFDYVALLLLGLQQPPEQWAILFVDLPHHRDKFLCIRESELWAVLR